MNEPRVARDLGILIGLEEEEEEEKEEKRGRAK